MIDESPLARVSALCRLRAEDPKSMWVIRRHTDEAKMTLTATQNKLLSLAFEAIAIEIDHAIEEGRQDHMLSRQGRKQSEREAIEVALQRTHGVQKDAAQLLGVSARALNYKMQTLGIERRRDKGPLRMVG